MAGDTPANRAQQSFSFTPQVARGRATSRGDFRLRQFGMHTTRRFLFAAETAASRLVAAGFHVPAIFIAPVRDALPQLDNFTYFRNPKFISPCFFSPPFQWLKTAGYRNVTPSESGTLCVNYFSLFVFLSDTFAQNIRISVIF